MDPEGLQPGRAWLALRIGPSGYTGCAASSRITCKGGLQPSSAPARAIVHLAMLKCSSLNRSSHSISAHWLHHMSLLRHSAHPQQCSAVPQRLQAFTSVSLKSNDWPGCCRCQGSSKLWPPSWPCMPPQLLPLVWKLPGPAQPRQAALHPKTCRPQSRVSVLKSASA